jgi:threonyl-tRNA synthetase
MREAQERTVAVRRFGSQSQTTLSLEDFILEFTKEIKNRAVFVDSTTAE